MLERIARLVTRKPKIVLVIALLLVIPAVLGNAATKVNYDILTYIPKNLDSSKGEALLEEPFRMAATATLIVEDMPADYVAQLQTEIEKIDGVSRVLSVAGLAGSQLPTSIIPAELTNMFYAGDGNLSSTKMMIFFDYPAASIETMEALDQIGDCANQKCFLAGFSVLITDMQSMVEEQMPLYIAAAGALAMTAMCVMMTSWILPVAIMLNIGLAILYNMGTNVFLGEISFVTSALAAILQLGVTMDYSVFLYNRYQEELENYADKRDAMAKAIQGAFVSLAGSSLTTIAGFAALCFMQLTLGMDVGIVMMKGVLLGILCVVLVLPSILLLLDKPIQRFTHRAFNPDTTGLNRFLVRHRRVFAIVALVSIAPAVYSQTHTEVYHDLIGKMLPSTSASMVASDKLAEDYDEVNQHFVLIHQDALTSVDTVNLVDELEQVEGIESVVTFRSFVGRSVPDFFIPDEVMEMFQRDGWTYIMMNSSIANGSPEMTEQINTVTEIAKSYDPGSYLTGAPAMSEDLFDTADEDFAMCTYASVFAILLIVAIVFRSVSMPVILVACIELAIFINEGVPYWTGDEIPFIANTFIGCIQLGATVDYSILLGTRYREDLQKGLDRKEAMVQAATSSDHSIITGGLVLFSACLSVALISDIGLAKSLCAMLARGTVISVIMCLFFVPPILTICEPLIQKTTLGWRGPRGKQKPVPETAETPVPAETAAE